MKKILILTAAIFMICASAVCAKNGDVIGKIYSTDIKAYVNGVQIPSYALDGKTAFIIEDITDNYTYSDPLRTLNCMMYWLNADSYDVKPDKVGRVLGNVYETDIVTYFRGTKIPCFALNGKMAVAIEDVGNDQAWSVYGAKYKWNPDERTISLDMIFDNTVKASNLASEKNISVVLKSGEAIMTKSTVYPEWTGLPTDDTGIYEIKYNDTVFGYEHCFPNINIYNHDNGQWQIRTSGTGQIRYFDLDKLGEVLDSIKYQELSADEWKQQYELKSYNIIDSLATDDYLFLVMSFGTPHGGTMSLVRVDLKTGERMNYHYEFESVSAYGTIWFDNVTIDRENETVSFRYDTDYIIDLKTCEMTKK